MSNTQTGNQSKAIILSLITLVIFAGLFALVLKAYNVENRVRDVAIEAGVSESEYPNRLDLEARIQSIDPIKGEMQVRILCLPQGNLADQNGTSTTRDLKVITNSTNKGEIILKKNQHINAVDATFELSGVVSEYPFDKHQVLLEAEALEAAAHAGEVGKVQLANERVARPAELASEPSSGEENLIPVRIELYGALNGLTLSEKVLSSEWIDYSAIEINISRSPLALAIIGFIMSMLWLMSLSVLSVTASVMFFGRKLEFASFTWIGAMIFAFFAFRNSAPGIPPMGAYFDFVSFFWGELILAFSLVALVCVYLVRSRPT